MIIIFVSANRKIFMKRTILILLILCLAVPFSTAQLWKMRRYEISAGLGPSMFFGDIGGYSRGENILGLKDLSFLQTRFNLSTSFKYRINRDINARINLVYGRLRATDTRGSNEGRELEAKTSVIEPSILGEYYFIKNKTENSYLFLKKRGSGLYNLLKSLDFYAFTGLGAVNFNVKGNEALQDVGLKNKGTAIIVPLGVGASLVFSPDLNFGIELGGRYPFTDYLDSYTSQFSGANDVYYFFNFIVSYKLKTGANGLPSFR
jgi:hypothetical protein